MAVYSLAPDAPLTFSEWIVGNPELGRQRIFETVFAAWGSRNSRQLAQDEICHQDCACIGESPMSSPSRDTEYKQHESHGHQATGVSEYELDAVWSKLMKPSGLEGL
jgi:hypothetical protein